jgi:hypothetical protein
VSRGRQARRHPPPTQWRQRAPYAFVSRVSRVYRAGVRTLLGSHTGSPGAREPPHRRLRTPRGRRTQKAAQSQDRPASASLRPHGPTHPHKQQFPDPSAQFPVALFGHFPRRAAAKAGRRARARAPSQFRQETHTHTPTPGLAQPAALWSQGWAAVQASTHARLPSPPRQAIAQSLVANAQLSATGSSTNLLHFACAGPRARGMHCFTQAKAYQ